MPPARGYFRGLKPIVELLAGGMGDSRPSWALKGNPLLGTGDAANLALVSVVLDNKDWLVPSVWDLNTKHMRAESVWRAEINGRGLGTHCSTSPCCNSIPRFSAKVFRSCPEEKWAFRKLNVTG